MTIMWFHLSGSRYGPFSKIEAYHPNIACHFTTIADSFWPFTRSVHLQKECSPSDENALREATALSGILAQMQTTCLTKLALYEFVPKTQPLLIKNFSRSKCTFTEVKCKNI